MTTENFEAEAEPGDYESSEKFSDSSDGSASHRQVLRFLLGRQYVRTSLVTAAVFTDRVWQHRLAARWTVAELTDRLGIVCATFASS